MESTPAQVTSDFHGALEETSAYEYLEIYDMADYLNLLLSAYEMKFWLRFFLNLRVFEDGSF